MIYEYCDWYKNIKNGSALDKFIEERSVGAPYSYCEDDRQVMIVNYIQCVKLEDIEKREPWSPSREENIKKWATPDNLRRLKYIQEEETGNRTIPHNAFHDMPMLSREFKLNNKNQEKFKISDGIHRINRARELRMDCILSSVEENVGIDKDDIENVEVKK